MPNIVQITNKIVTIVLILNVMYVEIPVILLEIVITTIVDNM